MVEDRQIGWMLAMDLHGLGDGAGTHELVGEGLLREQALDRHPIGRIVLDQEDSRFSLLWAIRRH